MGRLRDGEWLAAGGGVALLASLFLDWYGGRTAWQGLAVIDVLLAFPGLLLAIAMVAVLGPSLTNVVLALSLIGWVGYARLVRGQVLRAREFDFVQAARALGATTPRILLTHVLPNLAHLVLITFVLMFSGLVLSEAILSWLGIGIDGSWGQMIDQARDELARDPVIVWNLAAASAALFALILSVNIVGDALRDVLDPRTLRERR